MKERRKAKRKRWTDADIEALRSNYGVMPTTDLCSLLGRSRFALCMKAKSLGLTRKHKKSLFGINPWTEKEESFLRENAQNMTVVEAAGRLSRSVASVRMRGRALGLHFVDRRYYGKGQGAGQFEKAWPPEKQAILRAGAEAGKSVSEIAEECGKSRWAVRNAVRKLGLLLSRRKGGRQKGSFAGKRKAPETPAGYVSLADCAKRAGLSPRYVRFLCKKGRLACVRQKSRWFIAESELAALEQARAMKQEPKPKPVARKRKGASTKKSLAKPGQKIERQKLEGMSKLEILRMLASKAIEKCSQNE